MKLTIELDPTADRALFDRVMAAVMDHPAPVTMEASPAKSEDSPEPSPAKTETSDEKPRVYGEPGDGRKRRTKDEIAEDKEIEALADQTNLAIDMDVPASELLADMRQAAAEDAAEEEKEPAKEDKSFDLDEEQEDMTEEQFRAEALKLTKEQFRAHVLQMNKEFPKQTVAILSKYGSGIKTIDSKHYGDILSQLKEIG